MTDRRHSGPARLLRRIHHRLTSVRSPLAARLTGGRFGLGRWRADELAEIKRRAARDAESLKGLIS